MAEPLDSIVQAVRNRAYVMSYHCWTEFVRDMTRPAPSAIIASIGNDEPEIIEECPDDPRGACCLLLGINRHRRQVHTVVGYERHPMKIITAYHPTDDEWIDGRRRI